MVTRSSTRAGKIEKKIYRLEKRNSTGRPFCFYEIIIRGGPSRRNKGGGFRSQERTGQE